MAFYLDGAWVHTDNAKPMWMAGDDSAWTPTVGMHTIEVKGYRRNEGKGRTGFETTIRVVVIDSSTKAPAVKAPTIGSAASPVAPPSSVLSPVIVSVPAATAPMAWYQVRPLLWHLARQRPP
jgi:hypothetical protein